MRIEIDEFTMAEYDEACALWRAMREVELDDADTREKMADGPFVQSAEELLARGSDRRDRAMAQSGPGRHRAAWSPPC